MLDLSFLSFLFGLGSGFFEWRCRCDMIEMWWNVMKCSSFNCNNWRDEDWFWFCFRLFSFPQGLLLHLMGHLEQGSAKSVTKRTASKSWQKFWRFKKFSFGMKIFNLFQLYFPKKCTFIYLNLPVLCRSMFPCVLYVPPPSVPPADPGGDVRSSPLRNQWLCWPTKMEKTMTTAMIMKTYENNNEHTMYSNHLQSNIEIYVWWNMICCQIHT